MTRTLSVPCFLASFLPPALLATVIQLPAREVRADDTPPSAGATRPPDDRSPFRHHVALELGGPAVLYGFAYELQFHDLVGLRATGSLVPICFFDACGVLPIVAPGVAVWTPGRAHHAELGIAYSHVFLDDGDARFFVPSVGYRYQPEDSRIVVRVVATPLMRVNDLKDTLPWGSVSLGGRF
jgi:hypothetical protein